MITWNQYIAYITISFSSSDISIFVVFGLGVVPIIVSLVLYIYCLRRMMNALYKSYVWCLPYLLLLSSPSIRRHEISRIINACTCSTFYSYIIIGTSMALCMYKYVCMCMCAWCTLQTLRLRSPGGGVMSGSVTLGPSVMTIIILVHLLQPRRQRQNAILLFFL